MAGHPGTCCSGRHAIRGTSIIRRPVSSSGSAAAVAAGFSPATLGTDTGGSIRSPAAACGIAGLKPTYGLVSRRGVIPNCFSHDHAGPLAWTAEDVAILLQVIAGHDPEDPGSADVPIPDYAAALTGEVKGLTIGVPVNWLDDEAPPTAPTKAAFEAALNVFRGLGASVRPVTLPPLQQFDDAKKTIAVVELFTIHAADLRTRPELFGAGLRCRIIAGGLVRAEEYVQAMRLRTDLARAMQAGMAHVDLLMLPTGEPAGKLEPIPPSSLFTRTSSHAVQCRQQSGAVGVQRLCREWHAVRVADRGEAVRRVHGSCGAGDAHRRRRRGVTGVLCCSPGRPRDLRTRCWWTCGR